MPQKKTLSEKEYAKLAIKELIRALPFKWRAGIWLWKHQKLFWFVVKHLEIGEFAAPDGTKYKGFKFSFKW